MVKTIPQTFHAPAFCQNGNTCLGCITLVSLNIGKMVQCLSCLKIYRRLIAKRDIPFFGQQQEVFIKYEIETHLFVAMVLYG